MTLEVCERRAYLIDDEPRLRALVRQILAEAEVAVEEFGSAESFLAGHRDRPPGLIIVDIGLPGLDGLDLLDVISKGGGPSPGAETRATLSRDGRRLYFGSTRAAGRGSDIYVSTRDKVHPQD